MNPNFTESRNSQTLGYRVDLFHSDRCAAVSESRCYNGGVVLDTKGREVMRFVESEVLTNIKTSLLEDPAKSQHIPTEKRCSR